MALIDKTKTDELRAYIGKYLYLDADFAGRRGAEAICAILNGKYDVKYVPPPSGKDFNEYLQSRYRSREKVLRKREEMER